MSSGEADADVAIVGAGFAGMVAARELTRNGFTVIVLEGRDRLGGRTWTREWHGAVTELGGQWIHWAQPHVWAEVTRYGLPLYRRPDVARAYWRVNGSLRSARYEAFHDIYAPSWTALSSVARRYFPRPYEPLYEADLLAEIDGMSVGERLTQVTGGADAREICRCIAWVMFNAPGDDGAWTQLLRRVALAHGETELLTEIVARYRLRDGSRALIDAIAAECSADIRLSTAVSAVTSSDTAAAVQTEAGTVRARAAIVTAPLHAVRAITFEPSLAGAQQALIDEGQMTRGAMLWVLASGISEPTVAYAAGEVVSYAKWDGELDDKSLLNVFVPDVKAIDLNSLEAIQAGLELLLPEVQVHDVLFHNWVRDRFSRQTWTMLRPGQLTRSSVTCRPTDSRVFFAGSDYASGWLGFIDGAIESALRTTRQVRGLLGNERSA